ncbi:hypothetical protein ASPWEDRAFT_215316 [Aspergillus wentii DTO 134E9]|uniref:Uncharacterized protein n=1 Tax=Aspergillus wentii DTO 134E9 TaxID=1073089 RepID=A0A1L9RZT1_ASPWE|nr:uncharacterized protein ASPWEDRAFT_215316 [Aspergillus wentii DTO 134E9]OJJ40441.1 hypothetical protein ASPWEDRAFT_215316 [Aspergillus wentii DTO 134E9]
MQFISCWQLMKNTRDTGKVSLFAYCWILLLLVLDNTSQPQATKKTDRNDRRSSHVETQGSSQQPIADFHPAPHGSVNPKIFGLETE